MMDDIKAFFEFRKRMIKALMRAIVRCETDERYIRERIKVHPDWKADYDSFVTHMWQLPGARLAVKHKLTIRRLNQADGFNPANLALHHIGAGIVLKTHEDLKKLESLLKLAAAQK